MCSVSTQVCTCLFNVKMFTMGLIYCLERGASLIKLHLWFYMLGFPLLRVLRSCTSLIQHTTGVVIILIGGASKLAWVCGVRAVNCWQRRSGYYFHHSFLFAPFFFSPVATFSHRRSAQIKKLFSKSWPERPKTSLHLGSILLNCTIANVCLDLDFCKVSWMNKNVKWIILSE